MWLSYILIHHAPLKTVIYFHVCKVTALCWSLFFEIRNTLPCLKFALRRVCAWVTQYEQNSKGILQVLIFLCVWARVCGWVIFDVKIAVVTSPVALFPVAMIWCADSEQIFEPKLCDVFQKITYGPHSLSRARTHTHNTQQFLFCEMYPTYNVTIIISCDQVGRKKSTTFL